MIPAKRKRIDKYIVENPYCIYCGGGTPTFDRDHQPPKSIFDQHKWPDGYLFPSCQVCNNGSSDDDFLLSVLMKTSVEMIGIKIPEDELNALFKSLHKRRPDVYWKMGIKLTANQKRRKCKEMGLTLPEGETYAEQPILNLPEEFHDAVTRGGGKLIKALHFKNSGFIVPKNADVMIRWTTNADWLRGNYILDKAQLDKLFGVRDLSREKIDLTPQFNYSYLMTEDFRNSLFSCRFGAAFGIIGFISFDNLFPK